MTVTMEKRVWEDEANFIDSWSSDLGGTPTFFVYLDGELVNTTESTSMRFYAAPGTESGEPGEQPMIQVLDAAGEPTYAAPGRFWLSWYPDADAEYYLVEEAPKGVFSEIKRVTESGLGFYRCLTRWLWDGYDGQFRVTPVDAAGNAGAALVFVVTQVRHPDVPKVSYSYDPDTAKVTILQVGDEGIIDMTGERIIFSETGNGALSETIPSDTIQKDLIEIRLRLTDGPDDMSDVVMSIGPTSDLTDAVEVYTPLGDATSVHQIVNRFFTPALVGGDQSINVAWANSGGKIWELQIIYTII